MRVNGKNDQRNPYWLPGVICKKYQKVRSYCIISKKCNLAILNQHNHMGYCKILYNIHQYSNILSMIVGTFFPIYSFVLRLKSVCCDFCRAAGLGSSTSHWRSMLVTEAAARGNPNQSSGPCAAGTTCTANEGGQRGGVESLHDSVLGEPPLFQIFTLGLQVPFLHTRLTKILDLQISGFELINHHISQYSTSYTYYHISCYPAARRMRIQVVKLLPWQDDPQKRTSDFSSQVALKQAETEAQSKGRAPWSMSQLPSSFSLNMFDVFSCICSVKNC